MTEDRRDWENDLPKWVFVLAVMYGGFNGDYQALVGWLRLRDSLDQAVEDARGYLSP